MSKETKILKTDGGVIGIYGNPTTLLKWAICGPVINEILKEERMEICLNCIMKTQQVLRRIFTKIEIKLIASILE